MSNASNPTDSACATLSKVEQEHRLTFESLPEVEFWSAQKLAKALDYYEYRNFIPVIGGQLERRRRIAFLQHKVAPSNVFSAFDRKLFSGSRLQP